MEPSITDRRHKRTAAATPVSFMLHCLLLLLLLLLLPATMTQAFQLRPSLVHQQQRHRCPCTGSSSSSSYAYSNPPSTTLRMSKQEDGQQQQDRRTLLHTLSSSVATALAFLSTSPQPAQALRPPSKVTPPPPPSERPYLWQVLMSDPPQMQPYTKDGEKSVLQDMARRCNAVFLGEHPDSVQDKALTARLIEKLRRYKPRDASLTVGLEMVQQKFQPALDAYTSKSIADEAAADAALKEATEWDARWPSPFESYLPVLHLARKNNLKLLALGLESEALTKVRQVGLEGLSEEERGMYVADPSGFIQSVKFPGFKLYAERFIMPSYAARAASPTDDKSSLKVSASKFLAARILWDESMATKAVRHLKDNPKDLIVMLVGADHVKFGLGAPARLERLIEKAEVNIAPGRGKIRSILLNPTPADTGSETRRLRLTLGYAANLEKCRPVSDFMWFSEYPKVAWLEHPQNPISTVYTDEDTLFQVFSGRK